MGNTHTPGCSSITVIIFFIIHQALRRRSKTIFSKECSSISTNRHYIISLKDLCYQKLCKIFLDFSKGHQRNEKM